MKKILLILMCALFMTGISQAQTPVWSAFFGNPTPGTVYVAWNAGQYVFQTTGGNGDLEDFTDNYDDLASDIAEEYDWVSLGTVQQWPSSGSYRISLYLGNNQSNYARSFIYGNPQQNQAITVIQNPMPQSYPTLSPQGVHKIMPGERTTVSLTGTTLGENYYIRDENDQLIATIVGSGGNDSWSGLLTPGYYYVTNSDGDFTVAYDRLFSYHLGFDGEEVEIDADGGVAVLSSETVLDDQNGYLSWSYDEPVPELDSLSMKLNGGYSVYWNPEIEFSYEISEEGYLYLFISAPPNMTSDTLECRLYKASGDLFFHVVQPGGGHLAQRDVRFAESGSQVSAMITDSQYGVLYQLFRDGVICSIEEGNASNLALSAPSGGEEYHIEAVYNLQTMEIARAERINGQLLSLPSDRTWILTQHFNSDGAIASDLTVFNGLGYDDQELLIGAAGNGSKDRVQAHAYDYLFREAQRYLPFVETTRNGQPVAGALEKQTNYYRRLFGVYGDPCAYDETGYESTVIGRPLSSMKPGREYRTAEKEVVFDYGANVANQVFKLDLTSNNALYVSGFYPANSLNRKTVTDEDGNVTEVYTDKEGHTVLERRRLNATDWVETYYAYDPFGRPVWVVSPEGSRHLTNNSTYAVPDDEATYAENALQKYSYVYEYDGRGQIVTKHIPGCKRHEYTYDDAGRMVHMRDGNLREQSKRLSYVYDTLGRKTAEALVSTNGSDSTSLREYVYDTYPSGISSNLQYHAVSGITQDGNNDLRDPRTGGLLTYEKIRILGGSGYLERTYYYDIAGNIIQTNERHPGGPCLSTSTRYDRQGNVLNVKRDAIFGENDATHSLVESYSYDDRGHLVQSSSILDGTDQSTVGYTYNDLGQISKIQYGNGTEETLQYNMQGWRTVQDVKRNGQPLFGSTLRYYNPFNGSTTPCYAGNISSWTWKQGIQTAQTYVFTYDPLSRLTATRHYTGTTETNLYKENMTYDRNGNILSMARINNGNATNFSWWEYDGNQRIGEYSGYYDANGNLTTATDEEYPVWAEYNLLNLPAHLYQDESNLEYTLLYAADGTKISIIDEDSGNSEYYLGPFRYDPDATDDFDVAVSGGRMVSSAADVVMNYYIRDHLGSTRVVLDGNGTVLQQADYLPYGEKCYNPSLVSGNNAYLYGGKQLQTFIGIPWYDSQARYQNSEGIFSGIDPLCEQHYSLSPYAYAACNPVNCVDPDGRKIVFVNGLLAFGSPEGGSKYWSNSFVERAKSALNDRSIIFTDIKHSKLSSAEKRRLKGYEYAQNNYSFLKESMKEGESFIFVTHSMGAAFAEGMADYLLEQGETVSSLIHFEPYQANNIISNGKSDDVLTIDYQTNGDWVISLIGAGSVHGADIIIKDNPIGNSSYTTIHRNSIDNSVVWERLIAIIEAFFRE